MDIVSNPIPPQFQENRNFSISERSVGLTQGNPEFHFEACCCWVSQAQPNQSIWRSIAMSFPPIVISSAIAKLRRAFWSVLPSTRSGASHFCDRNPTHPSRAKGRCRRQRGHFTSKVSMNVRLGSTVKNKVGKILSVLRSHHFPIESKNSENAFTTG